MTTTIWKVELELADEQACFLPPGAVPLHAAEQHGKLCLWAIVEPNGESVPIRIRIVGTGHPFNDSEKWSHLSTVLMAEGMFVWHVFIPKAVTPWTESKFGSKAAAVAALNAASEPPGVVEDKAAQFVSGLQHVTPPGDAFDAEAEKMVREVDVGDNAFNIAFQHDDGKHVSTLAEASADYTVKKLRQWLSRYGRMCDERATARERAKATTTGTSNTRPYASVVADGKAVTTASLCSRCGGTDPTCYICGKPASGQPFDAEKMVEMALNCGISTAAAHLRAEWEAHAAGAASAKPSITEAEFGTLMESSVHAVSRRGYEAAAKLRDLRARLTGGDGFKYPPEAAQ